MRLHKHKAAALGSSVKKRSLRTYILIGLLFLGVIATNAYLIRSAYRKLYINNLQEEAGTLYRLPFFEITDYKSYEWLEDYWTTRELHSFHDQLMDLGTYERDVIEFNATKKFMKAVSAKDLEIMSEEERTRFANQSYCKIAYDFSNYYLLETKLSSVELIRYDPETQESTRIFWLWTPLDESSLYFSGKLQPQKDEFVRLLYEDNNWPSLKDEEDAAKPLVTMREYSTAAGDAYKFLDAAFDLGQLDGKTYFLLCRKDWKPIADVIDHDSLQISLITSTILLLIALLFVHMYQKYETEHIRISIEQERDAAELAVCRKIQLSQLPDPKAEFRKCGRTDISVLVDPAKEVGGDFCDCFPIGRDKTGLVIADVSDKGLSAAMFTMIAKTVIRSEMQQGRSPGEVMTRVNSRLSDRNEAEMFVTVWIATVDLNTGECISVNAGHENPVLRRAGGSWEMQSYPHDMPVAILGDAVFHERRTQLQCGDMLLVYTDGVTDAVDTAGRHFGEEQLERALNEGDNTDTKTVIDGLSAELSRYADGAEQFDDIGMICFRYLGK